MRVFLDFEASSLGKRSYPIEVAWVFEDGRSESHLIRPAPEWTDWDEAAAAVHKIGRDELEAEGTPLEHLARHLLDSLSMHEVYASAPSWDGKWLSTLFRAAGLPRHAMRLRTTAEARHEAAAEVLRHAVPDDDLEAEAARIVQAVEAEFETEPVAHRALGDAERERRLFLAIRSRALESTRLASAG